MTAREWSFIEAVRVLAPEMSLDGFKQLLKDSDGSQPSSPAIQRPPALARSTERVQADVRVSQSITYIGSTN